MFVAGVGLLSLCCVRDRVEITEYIPARHFKLPAAKLDTLIN
jgi:hypothetical protein